MDKKNIGRPPKSGREFFNYSIYIREAFEPIMVKFEKLLKHIEIIKEINNYFDDNIMKSLNMSASQRVSMRNKAIQCLIYNFVMKHKNVIGDNLNKTLPKDTNIKSKELNRLEEQT